MTSATTNSNGASREIALPDHIPSFLANYLPQHHPRGPGLPFITLTYAASLDSQLSLSPGVQTALSGPESKALTHYLRSKHHAILIGVTTAISDDPGLNCRLEGVGLDSQPIPVILDPTFRWQFSRDARVLRTAREGKGKAPWIFVGPRMHKEGEERIQWLVEAGGRLVVLNHDPQDTIWSWEYILRSLESYGLDSIMVEGGGAIINSMLMKGGREFVSSVVVTVAPTYLGEGGVKVCPGQDEDKKGRESAVRFQDVSWSVMGRDAVMAARIDDS